MEIRTEIDQVERQIYISADGKEFTDKDACLRYEVGLCVQKAEEEIEKLPKFYEYPDFEHDPEAEWTFYYLRSEDDLNNLRLTFNEDATADSNWESVPSFPCWVVAVSYDDGYGVFYTWDEITEMLNNFKQAVLRQMMDIERNILHPKEENK